LNAESPSPMLMFARRSPWVKINRFNKGRLVSGFIILVVNCTILIILIIIISSLWVDVVELEEQEMISDKALEPIVSSR
jgi:hypothetical protein